METVREPSQISSEKLVFDKVRKNKHDGQVVRTYYSGNIIRVRTPWMTTMFGASIPPGSKNNQYQLDLSFRGIDDEEDKNQVELAEFRDAMSAIDERIFKEAMNNLEKWWPTEEDLTEKDIRRWYTPIVRPALDKETKRPTDKYPPSVRTKIPAMEDGSWFNENGEPTVRVYSKEKDRDTGKRVMYDLNDRNIKDLIPKYSKVRCVLESSGLWFMAGGKFGMSWRCKQILTDPPRRNLDECAFFDDSDEEEETETERRASEERIVQDSEEEEEKVEEEKEEEVEEVEEVEVGEVEEKPKKRGRRKKGE